MSSVQVVATIETDKVAVEVRVEVGGHISNVFAKVGETVEVGQSLLSLEIVDTPPVVVDSPASAPLPPPMATLEEPPKKRTHVPLIKFLGKRSLMQAADHAAPRAKLTTTTTAAPAGSKTVAATRQPMLHAADVLALGAFYGRPRVTEEEIEAVQSGGASLLS